jgi:hypothetical protein
LANRIESIPEEVRMFSRLRRPSPATVISLIALFVALGGTAYALKLGRHSVGTRQLKFKSVGTKQLKNNAVSGAKVQDQTLDGSDINQATLTKVPGTVKPFTAALAANQSLNSTINGVTLTETANGSGGCTAVQLTVPKAGSAIAGNNATSSSLTSMAPDDTFIAGILNGDDLGQLAFTPSDGIGGATFFIAMNESGGRCQVTGFAAG